MAYSEYKLHRAHFSVMTAEVTALIASGWQPLGSAAPDGADPNYLTQTLVKGSNSTVEVGDILAVTDTVDIAYDASDTTDGIEASIQLTDGLGNAVSGIHTLNVWISDDTNGSGLTATAASGALTAATGTILTALTAKKHVIANTNTSGVLTLLLVDSANTAGERFCVTHPVTGKIVVGAATVATDYEGGV